MKKNIFLVGISVMMLSACVPPKTVKPVVGMAIDNHAKSIEELKKGVSIYFSTNETEVDSRYEMYLIAAAQILKNTPSMKLKIEGHTDSSGSVATNLRISGNRANSVRSRLIEEYNVNPNQLVATGLGPKYPIADNNTEAGRAKNRRVTLTLQMN